jgi:hypothetical protein
MMTTIREIHNDNPKIKIGNLKEIQKKCTRDKSICRLTMKKDKNSIGFKYDFDYIIPFNQLFDIGMVNKKIMKSILEKEELNMHCYSFYAEIIYFKIKDRIKSHYGGEYFYYIIMDLLFFYFGDPHNPENELYDLYIEQLAFSDLLTEDEEKKIVDEINNTYPFQKDSTEKERTIQMRVG